MIRLDEFYYIFKKKNLRFEGRHLVSTDTLTSENKRKNLIKKIFECLGDDRIYNENLLLRKKKICCHRGCVAPCCYEFRLKSELKNTMLTQEDIEEISEEINMKRIGEIGLEEYLKEYNKDKVDILKISLYDLKLIYDYARGKEIEK